MKLTCWTRALHSTGITEVADLNKRTISNNADTPPVITSPVPTMQCNGICSTTLRRSACSSAFILVHLASAPELSERQSSTNTPMATSVFELFNMRINIHTSTYRITLLVPKYAIVRVMPSWPPLLTSVQVLCWSYIAHLQYFFAVWVLITSIWATN